MNTRCHDNHLRNNDAAAEGFDKNIKMIHIYKVNTIWIKCWQIGQYQTAISSCAQAVFSTEDLWMCQDQMGRRCEEKTDPSREIKDPNVENRRIDFNSPSVLEQMASLDCKSLASRVQSFAINYRTSSRFSKIRTQVIHYVNCKNSTLNLFQFNTDDNGWIQSK